MRISALLLLTAVFVAFPAVAQDGSRHPSNCTDWKAWHNLQPGTAAHSLHVTATCQFPTAGYSVELVPANKKARSTKVLALRKLVHKPEGMAAQVISDVPLQYTLETNDDYTAVLIRPDKVRIKVEKVH